MFVEHKEAVEITEQPAKVLKLSEAIRIGSLIRPQGRGAYFAHGKSCALGAAYEAITGQYHGAGDGPSMVDWFETRFGIDYRVGAEITGRNDGGMTREEIADLLQERGL